MSQDLNYIHYTDKDGLPSNEVYGMDIDNEGYIWTITDKGISKFDGNKFTNYTSLNGLNDNVIFNTTHDYLGRIWLTTYNLKLNYILNGKIFNYKYNSLLQKQIPENYLGLTIGVGKNEKMFFTIDKDISIDKNGSIKHYDKLIIGNENIISIKNGKLQNEGNADFPLAKIVNEPWFYSPGRIVLYSKNGNYFFTRLNEMIYINKNGLFKKKYKEIISSICMDNKNRIWISFATKNLCLYNNLEEEPRIILENSSGKILDDKVGNIWFTSSYKGLYKFPNNFISSFTFANETLFCNLFSLQNKVVFSTYHGTDYEFNPLDKKVQKSNYEEVYLRKNLAFLDDLSFPEDHKIEFYNSFNVLHSSDNIITKSIQKEDEFYFLCCNSTLTKINRKTNEITEYETHTSRIKDMYYVNDNEIYIATINGIFLFDCANSTTKLLGQNTLFQNEHTQVIKKLSHYLLLGTKGKGLAVYSLQQKKIVHFYNQQNNVMPNSINSILVDNTNVWIGSNKGIYLFVFENGQLNYKNQLTLNDGLQSNDVIKLIKKDDFLYSITQNSLNILDLKNPDLFRNLPPNIPSIYEIKINGKAHTLQQSYTLNYDQNDIEIKFNSSYLLDKSRVSYYYQLKGNDNSWYSTQNNEINYNNLNPGRYTFIVYTSFENGKMNSKKASFNFTITVPFWRTTWFIIFCIVFALALLFGLISYYFYRKSQDDMHKRELIEYQQQSLRAQLQPHFIFNSLNSIQNFIIKNNISGGLDFIEKFANLTRAVLENTEHELTTIDKEIELVKNYLDIEKIRFANSFDYTFDIQKEIDINNVLIPTLLVQPLVENSLWHGLKMASKIGLIKIRIYKSNSFLCIEVEDNGIGFKQSLELKNEKEHQSKGLSNLKKRLELLRLNNSTIEIIDMKENELTSGTKIIITLPYLTK